MIIPVVITALALGRSFDYKTLKSGSYYIFDQTDVAKNLKTINRPFTNTHYKLLETSSDVNDFLDIQGEISLKAKRAQVEVQGYGDYAIKSVNREKTVEMLISVYHETLTETFPTYVKQRTDWKSRRPKDVGTHYIRSIIYGGRLIISYKMVTNSSENMEKIKAYLTGSIDAGGTFSGNIAGNMKKLEKDIGSSYKLTINAYATTGSNVRNPTNIQEVLEMVEAYPAMVKTINNGKGSPLKLDIEPIATLSSQYKINRRTVEMETMADEATNKYDDLNIANSEFKNWEGKQLWDETQQKAIDQYNKQLKSAFRAMVHAIGELDLTAREDLHHFDDAFEAYGIGVNNTPNRYMRLLIKLQHDVERIPYQWYPYTKAATHYIHWGSVNCTSPSPDPVYIGYAGAAPDGFGSGSNFLCLRNDEPVLETRTLSGRVPVSALNGISYQNLHWDSGPTYCASCRLENASMVVTIPASEECPSNMKLEYSGILTTNSILESDFICLDANPDSKIDTKSSEEDETASKLVPVWTKCHECEDSQNKFVPCVVCSR